MTKKGEIPESLERLVYQLISAINGGGRKLTAPQLWGKDPNNHLQAVTRMRSNLGIGLGEEIPPVGGLFDVNAFNLACKQIFDKLGEKEKAAIRDALAQEKGEVEEVDS